jgi:chromosome segregation ATPase
MSGELQVMDYSPDPRVAALERELRVVRQSLADAERELARARAESERALSALRKQLSPLYRALQAVFGELDSIPQDEREDTDRASPVWEAWKSKLSPACGKVIDALLIHKELNGQQICVAAQMGKNTMYDVITRLNKAGVLVKNGGRFSLKKL